MTVPSAPGTDASAELRSKLTALHDLLSDARAMPMSASCVVNRAEALALIQAAVEAVPDDTPVDTDPTEAEQVLADARERAAEMVSHTHVVEQARAEAERIVAEAREEADGLRGETDTFVDQRMASFESVLHKTLSQVQLARARLSARSGLDDRDDETDDEDGTAGQTRSAR